MHTKTDKLFYFFIGTTAELLRIAPIIKLLKARKIRYKLILSGQTKVKVEELYDYLGPVKPPVIFKEKVSKYSPALFFVWAVKTFFEGYAYLRNEFKNTNKESVFFVICGDPVSTSIGAILAKLNGLAVVHIESGDLSGNIIEPFPEEICRHINLYLADILFPPSTWAKNNLKSFKKPKINTFYNSVLESFYFFNKTKVRKNLIPKEKYYVLILHRQEHVLFKKKWSQNTLSLVIKNADPKLLCVIFNHPLTVGLIKSSGINVHDNKKIKIMPIVSYPEFLNLVKNSEFIATDGASNQFEAYLMGKPCLILRNFTEQIEGLKKNVVLYDNNDDRLTNFLRNYKKYKAKPVITDIKPSKIIVDYLLKLK